MNSCLTALLSAGLNSQVEHRSPIRGVFISATSAGVAAVVFHDVRDAVKARQFLNNDASSSVKEWAIEGKKLTCAFISRAEFKWVRFHPHRSRYYP